MAASRAGTQANAWAAVCEQRTRGYVGCSSGRTAAASALTASSRLAPRSARSCPAALDGIGGERSRGARTPWVASPDGPSGKPTAMRSPGRRLTKRRDALGDWRERARASDGRGGPGVCATRGLRALTGVPRCIALPCTEPTHAVHKSASAMRAQPARVLHHAVDGGSASDPVQGPTLQGLTVGRLP
jgi:hypothetical protein